MSRRIGLIAGAPGALDFRYPGIYIKIEFKIDVDDRTGLMSRQNWPGPDDKNDDCERPAIMTQGWVSPWNGSLLSADELIDEVALAALSRLYILSELGYPGHRLSIEADSIVIKSPPLDYSFVIYYPCELYETVKGYFSTCLLSLKKEYGVDLEGIDFESPGGEKMGEMLRYFHTLDRLIGLVSARHCWNLERVLAIHGVQSSEFLAKIESDLDHADIRYLVMYPLGEEPGSCFFKTIRIEEADSILETCNPVQAAIAAKLFSLEREYGPHALITNVGKMVA